MVSNLDNVPSKTDSGGSVRADVIILGCNLPGIVAAHKLKQKFGTTMDIMVLDMVGSNRRESKQTVAFQRTSKDNNIDEYLENNVYNKSILSNIAKKLLIKYSTEFHIPIHEAMFNPETDNKSLNKLFQYSDGNIVSCVDSYHNFSYLNFIERLELNQYQNLLDERVKELFRTKQNDRETKTLLFYDQTTMEVHICEALIFPNSRQIMRCIVHLVCGAPADSVSVLFYLHQCYRTAGCRNHVGGINTRVREKLLGYYRKHIKDKLQKSVADITLSVKPIKIIRLYPDAKVILETFKGTNYICSQLAMALRPDELKLIHLDEHLSTKEEINSYANMKPGLAKKFFVSYEESFWRKKGFSGDVFSIKGPIIWATEKPKLSSTDTDENYSTLIGYLKLEGKETCNFKEGVITQLCKLFGEEASSPMSYRETDIADILIPRCGDYVAIKNTSCGSNIRLEWGTLDVFADGDVASALEAGHKAYLNLVHYLRPQAQTFEDFCMTREPVIIEGVPLRRWVSGINYKNSFKFVAVSVVAWFVASKLIKSFTR